MSTSEDIEARRKQAAQEASERESRTRRRKDIFWTSVIASLTSIVVLLLLGVLTTQYVVKKAREDGEKEVVALRASICSIRFEQRPDAAAKLAEFNALSGTFKDAAVRKFVAEQGLATMLGKDAPAPGAVDICADAIVHSHPK